MVCRIPLDKKGTISSYPPGFPTKHILVRLSVRWRRTSQTLFVGKTLAFQNRTFLTPKFMPIFELMVGMTYYNDSYLKSNCFCLKHLSFAGGNGQHSCCKIIFKHPHKLYEQ